MKVLWLAGQVDESDTRIVEAIRNGAENAGWLFTREQAIQPSATIRLFGRGVEPDLPGSRECHLIALHKTDAKKLRYEVCSEPILDSWAGPSRRFRVSPETVEAGLPQWLRVINDSVEQAARQDLAKALEETQDQLRRWRNNSALLYVLLGRSQERVEELERQLERAEKELAFLRAAEDPRAIRGYAHYLATFTLSFLGAFGGGAGSSWVTPDPDPVVIEQAHEHQDSLQEALDRVTTACTALERGQRTEPEPGQGPPPDLGGGGTNQAG